MMPDKNAHTHTHNQKKKEKRYINKLIVLSTGSICQAIQTEQNQKTLDISFIHSLAHLTPFTLTAFVSSSSSSAQTVDAARCQTNPHFTVVSNKFSSLHATSSPLPFFLYSPFLCKLNTYLNQFCKNMWVSCTNSLLLHANTTPRIRRLKQLWSRLWQHDPVAIRSMQATERLLFRHQEVQVDKGNQITPHLKVLLARLDLDQFGRGNIPWPFCVPLVVLRLRGRKLFDIHVYRLKVRP
ncbi:hypothetical protein TCSYLVIO_006399 [Trypanosoma cruzi]|nr:hypothetical protein TCSYLVIO_006399 [Trypanosoma cruzi]